MFTINPFRHAVDGMDCCPWNAASGRMLRVPSSGHRARRVRAPLYTPAERLRRDASRWTFVQAVLAPAQFVVFLVSLALVLHALMSGHGYGVATASVVLKTAALYTIMVTGSIWERDVFGRYLFAPAFFWEDVVSILVLALHTAYLVALFSGAVDAPRLMWLALVAYASYLVNATQFLLKLRAARMQSGQGVVAIVGGPLGSVR